MEAGFWQMALIDKNIQEERCKNAGKALACAPHPRLLQGVDEAVPLQDVVHRGVVDRDLISFQAGCYGVLAPGRRSPQRDNHTFYILGGAVDGALIPRSYLKTNPSVLRVVAPMVVERIPVNVEMGAYLGNRSTI